MSAFSSPFLDHIWLETVLAYTSYHILCEFVCSSVLVDLEGLVFSVSSIPTGFSMSVHTVASIFFNIY